MFDHVKFGVSDYAASKAFFLKALEPLGVAVVSEGSPTYGIELSPDGKASLCLYQTEDKLAQLCARTITRTTMLLSSLVRTGTTSNWFAMNPRPNNRLQRTALPRRR